MTDKKLSIQFIRVLGIRSGDPAIIAKTGEFLVKWSPRTGWTCDCAEDEYNECSHVRDVDELIDPRIFNGRISQ